MKAVFMDYTGTAVQEKGIEIEQVVMRICKNSTLKDPKDALVRWWIGLKQYEESSYQESYLTEDEIVDCLLGDFEKEIGLKDNLAELHASIRSFWVNAPLFPDVKAFYENCPVPIYIISNIGIQYVEKSMTDKGLTPAGIICADMVRAYKPHKEIFEKALELSGCSANEVIHIGDSYASDVQGAMNAGIKPVLVQRKKKEDYPDTIVVNGLQEVLPLIK